MKKYTFHPELRRAIGKYRKQWQNRGAAQVIQDYANSIYPCAGYRAWGELVRYAYDFTFYAPSNVKVIPFRGTLVPVKFFKVE